MSTVLETTAPADAATTPVVVDGDAAMTTTNGDSTNTTKPKRHNNNCKENKTFNVEDVYDLSKSIPKVIER